MAINIYTVLGITNLDLHTNQRINWLNFVADGYAVADVIVIPELLLEAYC